MSRVRPLEREEREREPRKRRKLKRRCTVRRPVSAQAGQAAIRALGEAGESIVLYEAALLVENGLHLGLAGLIVVSVPESTQLTRLMDRDGMDHGAAQARLAAQLPLHKKLEVADFVIDNSGSLQSTAQQVSKVWRTLHQAA